MGWIWEKLQIKRWKLFTPKAKKAVIPKVKPDRWFKVISDGKAHSTYVYAPDGEPLGLIQRLVIVVDANQMYADITQLSINTGNNVVKVSTVPIVTELDIKIPESAVNIKTKNCDYYDLDCESKKEV